VTYHRQDKIIDIKVPRCIAACLIALAIWLVGNTALHAMELALRLGVIAPVVKGGQP